MVARWDILAVGARFRILVHLRWFPLAREHKDTEMWFVGRMGRDSLAADEFSHVIRTPLEVNVIIRGVRAPRGDELVPRSLAPLAGSHQCFGRGCLISLETELVGGGGSSILLCWRRRPTAALRGSAVVVVR